MELLDKDANAQLTANVTNTADETASSQIVDDPAATAQTEPETDTAAPEDVAPVTAPELLARLKTIIEQEENVSAEDLARFKQQFYNLHNERLRQERQKHNDDGNEAESFVPQPDPFEEEFKNLMNEIKEMKARQRAKIEAEQLSNLERKQAIIDRIMNMGDDTDNVNRHYPQPKELQNEFKTIGEVPQQKATEIWKAFQDAVEHFYDQWKVNKELRDYDFKKNLSEKELLVSEAVKLEAGEDVVTAFKRLQELHDKWREIGPVDKEHREEIWNRFKDASAVVNKRYQAFFEERKKREQDNEAAKTALCERIEAIDLSALNSYSAWNKATQEIMNAQEEWKKIGFASRKANNSLFTRFRKRCDEFFAAKAEYFHSVKDEMARNLEAKTLLCEQAEELMNSTDWKATTDKLVELQKQWKTIGTVQKKYSDTIWARFMAACDHFFEQKKTATAGVKKTEQANLATKREIVDTLTKLNAPDATTPRDEAIRTINELRAKWQQTGHVPFREKDKLHETYREVVRQLFDKYDIHETKARQASFENAIEELSADKNKLSRERERLMRTFESRRAELQTYENNLGFFNAKTKTGDSMMRDLQNKIQRIKNDIADLEKKIQLIDSKL